MFPLEANEPVPWVVFFDLLLIKGFSFEITSGISFIGGHVCDIMQPRWALCKDP